MSFVRFGYAIFKKDKLNSARVDVSPSGKYRIIADIEDIGKENTLLYDSGDKQEVLDVFNQLANDFDV